MEKKPRLMGKLYPSLVDDVFKTIGCLFLKGKMDACPASFNRQRTLHTADLIRN